MNMKHNDLLTDTPFVALDLDVLERNIEKIGQLAKDANVKLRPHIKTHKSPEVAKKQIAAGAAGITAATLGEAEVMDAAGIQDILIAYPLVGKKKLERFSELFKRNSLIVSLDDIVVAEGLNEVGRGHQKKVPIYVDVDAGLRRMGRSPEESVPSIMEISKLPFIEIKGLMSHTGHAGRQQTSEGMKRVAIEEATILHDVQQKCERLGLKIPEISVGATSTARFIKEIPYATEMRPGMYVYNDWGTVLNGAAQEADCAATVIATVVARPSKDRLIIDAGSKTLSSDPSRKGKGFGRVKGHDELTIQVLSEEHGAVEIEGETDLKIGDVIEVIPNHICPVINLADELFAFREGEFVKAMPVSARGKNR